MTDSMNCTHNHADYSYVDLARAWADFAAWQQERGGTMDEDSPIAETWNPPLNPAPKPFDTKSTINDLLDWFEKQHSKFDRQHFINSEMKMFDLTVAVDDSLYGYLPDEVIMPADLPKDTAKFAVAEHIRRIKDDIVFQSDDSPFTTMRVTEVSESDSHDVLMDYIAIESDYHAFGFYVANLIKQHDPKNRTDQELIEQIRSLMDEFRV